MFRKQDCFRNIDYFHFTTSGTSFLRQINIPRPMISRGPLTTPTTTPNHYYLPSKSFLPFCNCLCIWNIEGIGIGLSLNKNSGCFKILKTTVLLFRTVNPLVIQLHRHINFAMNKWQKLVSIACIDLASATFRRTHQLAVFVSKRFLQTGPNFPV